MFGVSPAFVCTRFKEEAAGIVNKLKSRFITLPKGEYFKEVMRIYKDSRGFPMCAGTIDGTHILVIAPPTNLDDFVDHKGYHIIVMQTVVDYEMIYEMNHMVNCGCEIK